MAFVEKKLPADAPIAAKGIKLGRLSFSIN